MIYHKTVEIMKIINQRKLEKNQYYDKILLRLNKLRGHLAVGYMTLNHVTLVRIQAPQPKNRIAVSARIRSVAKRRDRGFRENSPRVFEIQKKRAGREAGVRANLFKKISFGFEIFYGSDNYGLGDLRNVALLCTKKGP